MSTTIDPARDTNAARLARLTRLLKEAKWQAFDLREHGDPVMREAQSLIGKATSLVEQTIERVNLERQRALLQETAPGKCAICDSLFATVDAVHNEEPVKVCQPCFDYAMGEGA